MAGPVDGAQGLLGYDRAVDLFEFGDAVVACRAFSFQLFAEISEKETPAARTQRKPRMPRDHEVWNGPAAPWKPSDETKAVSSPACEMLGTAHSVSVVASIAETAASA